MVEIWQIFLKIKRGANKLKKLANFIKLYPQNNSANKSYALTSINPIEINIQIPDSLIKHKGKFNCCWFLRLFIFCVSISHVAFFVILFNLAVVRICCRENWLPSQITCKCMNLAFVRACNTHSMEKFNV